MTISRRTLKICCAVTTVLLIIIIVTAVTLYYTLFKPKQPIITTQEVTLNSFTINVFDVTDTNITLGVTVTVKNPNYGGFKYEKSTTYMSYRGDVMAEAPLLEDSIPARGQRNISTTVLVVGKKLITNSNFSKDMESKVLNLTSSTTLKGKAIVLKVFKKKATSYSTCDISINFVDNNATSICKSKVKF
ncbi:late embryogenesis abundant protein At1g64065 [Lactuca sativa]|uniref:late embryogenesis abundant protein At1g64065 n=1 Tax=Lactuca sativa TaxID=4236 RepID=UPI000CD853D4|nr:late embryogenesis abundant protein At1g64065 [Lactuca sativa]